MRRLIAIILLLAFIPILSYAAIPIEEVKIVYELNKNFENDLVGSVPLGVTCWSFKEKIYTDVDETGNRYMKFEEIENGEDFRGCYAQFPYGELEGSVVLEFKVNFLVPGDGRFYVSMEDSEGEESLLLRIDANRNLCEGSWTPAGFQFSSNQYYEVAIVVNQPEKKYDVYVDRSKKLSDLDFKDDNGLAGTRFRFSPYMIGKLGTGNITPITAVDDVRVYAGDKPVFVYESEGKNVVVEDKDNVPTAYYATDTQIKEHMKDTLSFYLNQNKAAIGGSVSYLDSENTQAVAKLVDDDILIPKKFITKNFESNVALNNLDARLIDGVAYVSLNDIAEILDKKITQDKSGMIVLSEKEEFFNMQTDLGVYRTLAGNLVYDIPENPADVVAAVAAKQPGNSHPRIMADNKRFAEIKKNIQTDPIVKKWFEAIIKKADSYLTGTYATKYPEGGDPFNLSSGYKQRMGTVALAYKLTDNKNYADWAVRLLLDACAFDAWAPENGLALADMMYTVAIGYDWLYDCLTSDQRKSVKDAVVKNGFEPIMKEYLNLPRESGYMWGQGKPDNFHLFCDGAGITLALAVCDESDIAESATEVLGYAMQHIRRAVCMFAPDGAWYEGPSYWSFLMVPYGTFVSSLEYAAGSTYGYLDVPGVKETCNFIAAVTSPSGIFAYHDCYDEFQTSPMMWYMARHLNDYGIASTEMQRREKLNTEPLFFDLLWYDPFETEDVDLQKDWYFRDSEVVTTRSNWSDNAIFAGLHAGANNVYHAHYDIGEFIIDGFGSRYAVALGRDTYDGNAAHRYRVRSEGTNTLVVNPDKTAGQSLNAVTRFGRFESNEDGVIATIDMTSAYPDLTKATRGMKTFDNRQRIILQDELEAKEPSDIYWFMHTAQEIKISSDGQTARIPGKSKDMIARLTCDNDAVFSVMNAEPLPTSPANPSTAYPNDAYQKLTIKLEDVVKATITVEFSFVNSGTEEAKAKREVTSIDNWELDAPKAEELVPQFYIPLNNFSTSNKIFAPTEGTALTYQFKDDAEQVLKIENTTSSTGKVHSAKYDTTGKSGIVYSFDIKRLTDTLCRVYMNNAAGILKIDSDGSVNFTDKAVSYKLNKDEWYSFIIKVDYDTRRVFATIKDSSGSVVHHVAYNQTSSAHIINEMSGKPQSSFDFYLLAGGIYYLDNFSVRTLVKSDKEEMNITPVTAQTIVDESYDSLTETQPQVAPGIMNLQSVWGYNGNGSIEGGTGGTYSIKPSSKNSSDMCLELNMNNSSDDYVEYMYAASVSGSEAYIQDVTFSYEEAVTSMELAYKEPSGTTVATLDFAADKLYLGSKASSTSIDFNFQHGKTYRVRAYFVMGHSLAKVEITDGEHSAILEGKLDYITSETISQAPYIKFCYNESANANKKIFIYKNSIYTTTKEHCKLKIVYSDFKLNKKAVETGKIIASVEVVANASFTGYVNKNLKLYLAVYDGDGSLRELALTDVSPNTSTYSAELNINSSDERIKAMLWNTEDGSLSPIFAPVEIR